MLRTFSKNFKSLPRFLHCSFDSSIRGGVRLFSDEIPKHQIPLETGRQRVVALGTGWGCSRLARDLNSKLYDLTIVSPRNHMVFTPLLASCCVGTLEPRSVALPVLDIQPALRGPPNDYLSAEAVSVDPSAKTVLCKDAKGLTFMVDYDILVIGTGSQGSTFGIPGVEKYTRFLRNIRDVEGIRNHLLENWQLSNIPGRRMTERMRLLSTVVVGGGPTGVEFAGELVDFISHDLRRIDGERARDMRVTLVEANELLSSFDTRLREYATRKLHQAGVHLVKGIVKEVREDHVELRGGEVLPYGLCVWSTGVGPTPFTTSLPFARTSRGRIAVDDCLRVLVQKERSHPADIRGTGPASEAEVKINNNEEQHTEDTVLEPLGDVYALGDCCANVDRPLPALAQVAEQQGSYLALCLNKAARGGEDAPAAPFVYRHLGSMATVGEGKGLLQLGDKPAQRLSFTGFASWVAWRSAYLTRLGNWRNRLYVAINWTTSLLFGRDVSRW
eukprot:jgi/Botrbrau1/7901/Bobra.9_2s0074.1